MGKEYKIGEKILKHPIVQGGMGVGISLGGLAGAVAQTGGIGTISTVGVGYREPDYYRNNVEANKRALKKEVDKAKEISQGNGLVAINIMEAITEYEELVEFASTTGADMIVVGAGLPLSLPKHVKNPNVLIGPIVSSQRALRLIVRSWKKKFNKKLDFAVIEGPKAAGHLGFAREDIEEINVLNILKDVRAYMKKESLDFPLILAGGIKNSSDVKESIDQGADFVQLGTRFIGTVECDASDTYKEYVMSSDSDDVKIVQSPVGMPGRAIHTKLLDDIKTERKPAKHCVNCLKPCNPKTTQYCIQDALFNAVKGNVDQGLVFGGFGVDCMKGLTSVKELIKELTKEL